VDILPLRDFDGNPLIATMTIALSSATLFTINDLMKFLN
jgi:hypothetical protein